MPLAYPEAGVAMLSNDWLRRMYDKYFVFTFKRRAKFYLYLSNMISAGMTMKDIVLSLSGIYSGEYAPGDRVIRSDRASEAFYRPFIEALSSGQDIGAALDAIGVIPTLEVTTIKAGSTSGRLQESIKHIMVFNQNAEKLRGMFLSVALKFFLATSVTIGTTMYFGVSILPTIVESTGKPMPKGAIGDYVIQFSNFFASSWWMVIAVIVGVVLLINYLLANATGRVRESLDKWPLISVYRDYYAFITLKTISMLQRSGVVAKDALLLLQQNANPYYFHYLQQAHDELELGRDLDAMLSVGLFDDQIVIDVAIFNRAGKLNENLTSLSDMVMERYFAKLERLSQFMTLVAFVLPIGSILMQNLALYSAL